MTCPALPTGAPLLIAALALFITGAVLAIRAYRGRPGRG